MSSSIIRPYQIYSLYVIDIPMHRLSFSDTEESKLGSSASQCLARGVFSMPSLRTLDIWNMELHDVFYETMEKEAGSSRVGKFLLCSGIIELEP